MKIERVLHRQSHTFTLTETELEQAYRIMEKRYLEEDFVNTMSNSLHEPDSRFHSGHLDEFPELLSWLCSCFHHFFDANMSHNDILQLTLNHLNHISMKPQFFLELSKAVLADCMGTEKELSDCEQNCSVYHYCNHSAEARDRCAQWEILASLLSMHGNGNCTCYREDGARECPAAKYLNGIWDISEFFHLDGRKEAA